MKLTDEQRVALTWAISEAKRKSIMGIAADLESLLNRPDHSGDGGDFQPMTPEREQAIAVSVGQKYGDACAAAVELAYQAAPVPQDGDEQARKPIIDSPDILERIKGAKERLRDGHALMRIPVDPTDPDCVLADAELEIERLRAALTSSLVREPVACRLCNSTGSDTPCAYPTEINRQQAKRIAELLEQIAALQPPSPDALYTMDQMREYADAFHKSRAQAIDKSMIKRLAVQHGLIGERGLTEEQMENRDVRIKRLAEKHSRPRNEALQWVFENHELFKFSYALLAAAQPASGGE